MAKFTWSAVAVLACLFFSWAHATLDKATDTSKEEMPSKFGQNHLSAGNFQSWHDWLNKRGLNSPAAWQLGDAARDGFQSWNDWMYKRGGLRTPFVDGTFSTKDKVSLQAWKDWMYKRGLISANSGITFPKSIGASKGQFQQWNDYVSKRGLLSSESKGTMFPTILGADKSQFQQWNNWAKRTFFTSPARFGFNPGKGDTYQSWVEFMKRQGFPLTSINDAGQSQLGKDWVKRMGSLSGRVNAFGKSDFGNKDKYMNWRAMFKRSADKRQLLYNPFKFGSSYNMFTSGLQDWRSSFSGVKRNAGEQNKQEEKQ